MGLEIYDLKAGAAILRLAFDPAGFAGNEGFTLYRLEGAICP